MSKCAHEQSTYVLHKLPRCSKCKQEFQLVTARYETPNGKGKIVEEWECMKCGKIVPKTSLREQPLSEQDKILSEWCKNEQKQRARREKTRENRSGY